MATRRYRVSFVASFDITIDADDDDDAKWRAACLVNAKDGWAGDFGIDAENVRCAWNTIERVDAD